MYISPPFSTDVRGGLRDEIPCHTPCAVYTGEYSRKIKVASISYSNSSNSHYLATVATAPSCMPFFHF